MTTDERSGRARTGRTGRAPDTGADTVWAGDVREWAEEQGLEWTTEPIEETSADAVYCPVPDVGRTNPTLEALHRSDRALRRHWQRTTHRPAGRGGTKGPRTRILAVLDGHRPRRWVLYADEAEGPGSGIVTAARYAEQAGLQSLAIGPGTDPGLAETDAKIAILTATARHGTRLLIHSGPVHR